MLLQSDGKIIVGGDFTTLGGQTRNYLSRINSDLSVDTDFNSALGTGPSSTVKTLCFDGEGKLFVGGNFTSFDSNVVGYLLRLQ
jgi:hypothetical protein